MNEVINFENGKYVWQEVTGKGKCLVPYVEPPKTTDALEGADICDSFMSCERKIFTIVRIKVNKNFYFTITTTNVEVHHEHANAHGIAEKTIEKLINKLRQDYPYWVNTLIKVV